MSLAVYITDSRAGDCTTKLDDMPFLTSTVIYNLCNLIVLFQSYGQINKDTVQACFICLSPRVSESRILEGYLLITRVIVLLKQT